MAGPGGIILPKGAVCFCTLCNVFFPTWSRLDIHIVDTHRGKKMRRSRRCPHCWKAFRHTRALNSHVSTGCHAFPYPVKKHHVEEEDGSCKIVDVLELPEFADSDEHVEGVLHNN